MTPCVDLNDLFDGIEDLWDVVNGNTTRLSRRVGTLQDDVDRLDETRKRFATAPEAGLEPVSSEDA